MSKYQNYESVFKPRKPRGPPINWDELIKQYELEQGKSTTLYSGINKKLATNAPPVKFQCGDLKFMIPSHRLNQIPYLEAIASGNFLEKPDGQGIIHLDPFFCRPKFWLPISRYLLNGWAGDLCTHQDKEFVSPTDIFEMLDYVGVEKPECTMYELTKGLSGVYIGCGRNRKGIRNPCISRMEWDVAVILCWLGPDLIKTPDDQQSFDTLIIDIMKDTEVFHIQVREFVMNFYNEAFPKRKAVRDEIWEEWTDNFPSDAREFMEEIQKHRLAASAPRNRRVGHIPSSCATSSASSSDLE